MREKRYAWYRKKLLRMFPIKVQTLEGLMKPVGENRKWHPVAFVHEQRASTVYSVTRW